MYFELSVIIERPPAAVFAFLRDKHEYPQKPGSPVLLIEKTTSSPPGLGTQYREVVQMFPLVQGEILSEIIRYEPYRFLEERFQGAGMQGHLAYEFMPQEGDTQLIQRETLEPLGWLRIIRPLIKWALAPRLQERLEAIKVELESGQSRR